MPTIHKALTNTGVLQELTVIHTIVKEHEGTVVLILPLCANYLSLPGYHPFYGIFVVLTINK